MNKILIGLLSIALLTSCNGTSPNKINKDSLSQKIADSIKRKKAIDSTMATSARPDNEQDGLSFDAVKSDLLSSYNKIDHIDTVVIIGKDSLKIHEKYYCLHDSALIIPKKYLWGGDKSKDFVTHNFVSNIMVIKNRDTIINKTFKKSDFNGVINPEEKQYAILFAPGFTGYKKQYDGVIFGYSISIPLTDVGVPAFILINKNGNYRILDEYAKIN
jgi:hypothetical protein